MRRPPYDARTLGLINCARGSRHSFSLFPFAFSLFISLNPMNDRGRTEKSHSPVPKNNACLFPQFTVQY